MRWIDGTSVKTLRNTPRPKSRSTCSPRVVGPWRFFSSISRTAFSSSKSSYSATGILSLTQQDFDLNEEALECAWPIATRTTVNQKNNTLDYHTQPRDAFVKHVSCG